MSISYVIGDATEPQVSDGLKLIAHICNDIGLFGSGFAAAVMRKWPHVREKYLIWHGNNGSEPFEAGRIQVVKVDKSLFVANMIGQNGVRSAANPVPANLEAIDNCLAKIACFMSCYRTIKYFTNIPAAINEFDITLHMPRIACGLAGQTWDNIEPLIKKHFEAQYNVYIYDLPPVLYKCTFGW